MERLKKDTSADYILAKMLACLIILFLVLGLKRYNFGVYEFISNWYKNMVMYKSVDIEALSGKIYFLVESKAKPIVFGAYDVIKSTVF